MQLLPTLHTQQVELVGMKVEAQAIVITLKCMAPSAPCPTCQQWSQSIHSRYVRHLSDLPWGSVPVQIALQVRRFRCATPDCRRYYFTERLPDLAFPYRRRTNRFQEWLATFALAFGGEPAARALALLGLVVSGDTCLRMIRDTPAPVAGTPRVLGVDDWAWRKGRAYGTILCDLERHCVIDLLPDREAKTFATWLEAHPGIEVICRDRASAYAEAARERAPAAQQVADRFHLLMNLTETVKKVVERNRQCLRLPLPDAPSVGATPSPTLEVPPAPPPAGSVDLQVSPPSEPPPLGSAPSPRQHLIAERRARRRERYEQVVTLHNLGVSGRKIAQQLGLSRPTVERYLRIGHYPEHARRGETIRPYADYLRERWQAGARVAIRLFEEIQPQGYRGSYLAVTRFVTALKHSGLQEYPTLALASAAEGSPPTLEPKPKLKSVAPRQVAHLLTTPTADLTAERQPEVAWLCQRFPELATAHRLAQAFGQMVREQLAEQFPAWLDDAASSGLPDFRNFAASLRRDQEAVTAALTTSWSSGQVEGQVNRLKLLKRTMFGRGKLDLLKKRLCS